MKVAVGGRHGCGVVTRRVNQGGREECFGGPGAGLGVAVSSSKMRSWSRHFRLLRMDAAGELKGRCEQKAGARALVRHSKHSELVSRGGLGVVRELKKGDALKLRR